jgi:hypothetical protein
VEFFNLLDLTSKETGYNFGWRPKVSRKGHSAQPSTNDENFAEDIGPFTILFARIFGEGVTCLT